MRATFPLLLSLLLFTTPAFAQDPELLARDPAAIDALLRSSCYCIQCTTADIDDLVAAQCRFIRWGVYPFISPNRLSQPSNYQQRLDNIFTNFTTFVSEYKRRTSADNVVEFAIPEIITAGIETVSLGDTHADLARLNIIPDLPAGYRFRFGDVRVEKHGDYHWRDDPEFEKNGVPSLVTPAGRLWASYLALRAIRAGADSIYFAQPQMRVSTSDDLQRMVRTIRRLRPTTRQPLLFGASATHHIMKGTAVKPLRDFIDYAKVTVDIDSYRVANGARYMLRHTGERVPCELLAKAANNDRLLPLTTKPGLKYICMIATNQADRSVSPRGGVAPSFNQSNPYDLRLLMELDGSQKCESNGERVWYFLGAGDNLTSNCYPQVRHGLPTTLWFLSRSHEARAAFIEYMYRLANKLTTSTRSVFFPVPIRVDQNEMKFVLQQKDCPLAPVDMTCSASCTGKDWLRLLQVQNIPGCPGPNARDGRFCAVADKHYLARECMPDLVTVTGLLPRVMP